MSNSKLYVGNLSFETLELELEDLFKQAGTVTEAALMQDRMTGKSRGFAFVTMGTPEEAKKAIEMFNGKQLGGRALTVNEARPREAGGGGGGGGGGGQRRSFGGGGGGGGGGGRRDYQRY
jgi:RNA recognition motif-containing protein